MVDVGQYLTSYMIFLGLFSKVIITLKEDLTFVLRFLVILSVIMPALVVASDPFFFPFFFTMAYQV
jgi:hypothetical protein